MIDTNGCACPLCQSTAGISTTAFGRNLVHCPQCDLIFVPASDHLDAEAEKSRYLRHENSIEDLPYVATFDAPIEALVTHAPNARRILDFGSGPSPVLVKLLRQRGYDTISHDLYFANDADLSAPFDAILSVETFEHFRDPHRELELIRSRLAPGAPLIVKTLFHPGLNAVEQWHYVRDKTHIAFYSPRTFEWIAEAFELHLVAHDDHSLACLIASNHA